MELAEDKSVTLDATIQDPKNWKQDGGSFVLNKYQWYKDGKAIPGETKSTYTIANYNGSFDGVYHCTITNIIAPKLRLSTGKTTIKQLVSVSEVTKPELIITRDADRLYAEGAQEMTLYNMEGACISRSEGDSLAIEGVAAGCYLIVVTIDNVRHTVRYIL